MFCGDHLWNKPLGDERQLHGLGNLGMWKFAILGIAWVICTASAGQLSAFCTLCNLCEKPWFISNQGLDLMLVDDELLVVRLFVQ